MGVLEKFLSLNKQKWLWETERDRNSFRIWSSPKCFYKTNLRKFTVKNWKAMEKGVGSFTSQGWVLLNCTSWKGRTLLPDMWLETCRYGPTGMLWGMQTPKTFSELWGHISSVNKTLGLYVGTLTYAKLCCRKQRPWRCNLHITKFTHNECFSFFLYNSDV